MAESWLTRLSRQGLHEGIWALVIEGAKTILSWPGFTAVLILAARYLNPEQAPWTYAIAAAVFGYASAVTGLLRFSEWRRQQDPQDKIGPAGAFVAFEYARNPDTGKVTGVTYAQVLFFLVNNANFPMSLVVEELTSSVDGKVNMNPTPLKVDVVPPHTVLEVRHDRIDMGGEAAKDRLEARLRYRFRYGRRGAEKYELSKKMSVTCAFDTKNDLYSPGIAGDLPINTP